MNDNASSFVEISLLVSVGWNPCCTLELSISLTNHKYYTWRAPAAAGRDRLMEDTLGTMKRGTKCLTLQVMTLPLFDADPPPPTHLFLLPIHR
jgi:hypothetical protein